MYDLKDTIVAVSSPTSDEGVIFRITGPATFEKVSAVFKPALAANKPAIVSGGVVINGGLVIDANLYLFVAGHSYTGEPLAEIHMRTNRSVAEVLMGRFFQMGLRMAGPGEFTARSFLNGRIDLAQAEAINEIIVSSNEFQLDAAEKLLAGRLAEVVSKIRAEIMDCLSLIEAGLDFSGEEIEFISCAEAVRRLCGIKDELQRMLCGSISYESMLGLPSVGIAGAPNAGKSSLLNRLLGKKRSIVSSQPKTTRDVLTGLLELKHNRCVLFDCAGLVPEPCSIIEELAQQAAIEGLRNSSVVVFCVDVSKKDWAEDISIRRLIESESLLPVATKSDLLNVQALAECLAKLEGLFGEGFLAVSSKNGAGIEKLLREIDKKLVERFSVPAGSESVAALTARHKQTVTEAIENVSESVDELRAQNDEVAAMMLRAAYEALCAIERQHIDDKILENIFERFCIGK
jgi:tRNA modification GTPase